MGKYQFDGKKFYSKKDAEGHIRNLLKTVGICKSVKDKNKQIFERVSKILSRHAGAIRKGVIDPYNNIIMQDFQIQLNINSAFQINILKDDGSQQVISWRRCVDPEQKTHAQKLDSAMRFAIKDQIFQFKKQNPQQKCENKNCTNQLDYDFHVDHEIRFKDLKKEFFKIMSGDLIKDFDDDPKTNMKKFKECDKKWEDQWKAFHRKKAKLRYLCWLCNLKRSKQERENDY